MKKILSVLLSVAMIAAIIASMAVSSSAVDVDPNYVWNIVDAEEGKRFVINMGDPYQFNPDCEARGYYTGLFQWKLNSGCAVSEGALHVPAVVGGRTMITINADLSAGWSAPAVAFNTATYKYFTMTYKTEDTDARFHIMFSYNTADGSEFDVNGCNPDFALPACSDYTTVVYKIPQNKVQQAVSKMTRFDVFNTQTVYIKTMGFFADYSDAVNYFDNVNKSTAGELGTASASIRVKDGKYVINNLKNKSLFTAGTGIYGTWAPAHTDTAEGIVYTGGEMNTYANLMDGGTNQFNGTFKYAAVRYKTNTDSTIRVRMAPDIPDWGSAWGDLDHYSVVAELPATNNYQVAIVELTAEMKALDKVLLVGLAPNSPAEFSVEITDFGFFATENDAKIAFGIGENGKTSDTVIVSAVAVAVAAIVCGVVIGRKKEF